MRGVFVDVIHQNCRKRLEALGLKTQMTRLLESDHIPVLALEGFPQAEILDLAGAWIRMFFVGVSLWIVWVGLECLEITHMLLEGVSTKIGSENQEPLTSGLGETGQKRGDIVGKTVSDREKFDRGAWSFG